MEVKKNCGRAGVRGGRKLPAAWLAVGGVLVLWPAAPPAVVVAGAMAAERVSGRALVVDGDTLKFPQAGVRVRLEGLDAPELGQSCTDGEGVRYACGKAARSALVKRIGEKGVSCSGGGKDRYNRIIAVCVASDGTNLNSWLVRNGWALAYRRYSLRYVREEREAKMSRRGVWSGRFVKPWRWRSQRR